MPVLSDTTAYLRPESRSAQAFAAATRVLAGGVSRGTIFREPYPPFMAYGRGSRLVDLDGDERIDFLNNYTALIHGHAHPLIVERINVEVQRGASYSFPTVVEAELAGRIVDRLPAGERVRLTNSGTEAVMLALRLARDATGRDRFAKFEGCFHGTYDDARVSEGASLGALGRVDRPNSVLEPGLSRGSGQAVLTLPFNRTELANALIEEHAHELAAVLVDPAPNRCGLVVGSPVFLRNLREVTRKHGIVLIFDEMITFRVTRGTQWKLEIAPDLTTLGKIVGGGLPIGAVAGRATLLDQLDLRRINGVAHGGTFKGNAAAMAAGVAALDLLTDAECERINALAAQLGSRLEEALRANGAPCRINVVGSLFAVHLCEDEVTDYRSLMADPTARTRSAAFAAALLARGIVLSLNGLGCLSTPMTEEDIDTFIGSALPAAEEAYERALIGGDVLAGTSVA